MIERIFYKFVKMGLSERQIAQELNASGKRRQQLIEALRKWQEQAQARALRRRLKDDAGATIDFQTWARAVRRCHRRRRRRP